MVPSNGDFSKRENLVNFQPFSLNTQKSRPHIFFPQDNNFTSFFDGLRKIKNVYKIMHYDVLSDPFKPLFSLVL